MLEPLKFSVGTLSSGENITLVMRQKTVERLRGTCFRGMHLARAGNFFRFGSFQELLSHLRDDVDDEVREAIERYVASGNVGPSFLESFEIEDDTSVGWSSTDDLERYHESELEPFEPSKRSRALRLRLSTDRRAPLTKLVTFVCEFRHEDRAAEPGSDRRDWTVVVHSLYPGRDIGSLEDDVTAREGVVFFGWEHPGQPLE